MKIEKIIHISDIHIFQNKNFEIHKHVFENFYKSLEKEKFELIVCTGDLFDSKLKLSPEQISLARNFLLKLSSFSPIILILGNHDLNLANAERLDSITPIIESLEGNTKNPIHFLKHTGIYPIYGIDWAVWSCLDNQRKPDFLPTKNYTIGLYHGTVKNCVSESGFVLTEGIEIEEFADTDITLLGDIHKTQFFRDREIAYPGSFLQTKISEEVEGNYLLWKWNGKKFIPNLKRINNEYSTVVQNISELANLKLNEKQNYIFRYDPDLFSRTDIFEFKKEFGQKNKISFEPIITKSKKVQIKTNEEKKKVLIKSIEEYLYYLKVENKKEIIDLDNFYNSNLDLNKDFEYGDYSILKMEISNFLCFGVNTQTINFDKVGIIGINGENKIGKTSIISAIEFCLFNSTKNDSATLRKIINKHNRSEPCFVSLEIEKNGKVYKIKRTLIPKKKDLNAVSIELEFDNLTENISLKGEKRQETEKEIQKHFGLESSFQMMSLYSAQKKQLEFMDCKNSERLALANKFLGFQHYEQKEKEVSEHIKSKKAVYLELQKKIDKYDTLSELESKFEDKNNQILEYQSKIDKIKNDLLTLKQKNKLLVETWNYFLPLSKKPYKNSIEIENLISLKENKILENIKKIKELELLKIDNELIQKNKQKEKSEKFGETLEDNQEVNDNLAVCKSEIKKLEQQLKIDICNTCNKEFSKEDKQKIISKIEQLKIENDLLNQKVLEFEDLKKSFQSIKKEIKEYKELISLQIQQTEKFKNENEKIDLEIKLEKEKTNSYGEIKKAIEKIDEIKNSYEDYLNEITNQEEKLNSFQNKISVEKNLISKLEVNIENLKSDLIRLSEIEKEYNLLKQYKEIISKTGLPLFLLKNKVEEINSQINLIVGKIFTFEIVFSINEENGELNIDFYYPNDKEKDDVGLASGSETFIINLCIKVGLSQLSEIPKLTSLLIDEGYGTLDEKNLDKIPGLFEILPFFYKNILTVSHIDKLKELYQHEILLYKKGEFSLIK